MYVAYNSTGVTRARFLIKRRAMASMEADDYVCLLKGCKCDSHGKKCLISFREQEYSSRQVCSFDIDHILHERHRVHFHILRVFWFMRTALRMEKNNFGGYDATEGFAGSGPLAVLELIASRFPHNERVNGRWESLVDPTLAAPIHWTPNDADYFIIAATAALFFTRVNQIIALLSKVVEDYNVRLSVKEPYQNFYAYNEQPIWIVNLRIGHLETPISFIQTPNCRNMYEVIDKFDIDVARVFYDCASSGKVFVNSNIFESIRAGFAETDDFVVNPGGPTAFETRKISSTIGRMHKCGEGERRYTFRNYPEFQIDLDRAVPL